MIDDVERPEDLDDVMDNPEWSPADIKAGKRLVDYEPELAANISRALKRGAQDAVRTGGQQTGGQAGDGLQESSKGVAKTGDGLTGPTH